ncbi:hypothetical protein B0H67DRAFT_611850 [Lasiosphaeris hirsuta]|uniref:Nephrocystin 3-like N-terminal domain-containing protein n=1 Tax=Lasiosphaeris hirsuta TaxID=260670 RepID=A0AA40DSN3_9PEZI|nr:hypothetical protein B0H67DRAFT_611850 [Lasiosphaeris hirsuta]
MSEEDLSVRMREAVNDPSELEPFMEWKMGEGATLHPALQVPTVFDKQRAEFMRPLPYKELEDLLRRLSQDPEFANKTNLNLTNCTWDDVLDVMREAKKKYNDKTEKNPLRRFLRHGTAIAGAAEMFLDLIPDEYGLNILRVGLSVVFKTISQREENRENIFSALERITETWVDLKELCQTLPVRPIQELQDKIRKLYVELLEDIPKLIDNLAHKHRLKFPARILASTPYQEASEIDEIVQRLKNSSRLLERYRNHLWDAAFAALYGVATQTNYSINAVRQTIPAGFRSLGKQEEENGRKLDTLLARRNTELEAHLVESVKAAVKEQQESATSSIPSWIYAPFQKGLYFLVVDSHYGYGATPDAPLDCANEQSSGSPVRALQNGPDPWSAADAQDSSVTLVQILGILDVPVSGHTEDLQRVVDVGNTMTTQALQRGWWLMSTPAFHNWLGHPAQSDVLLVDGHCGAFAVGKTSPLSVFCASLALSLLLTTPSTISLHHFCGQHFSPQDSLRGPQGVLRGLITQLLQYPDTPEPSLGFVDDRVLAQLARRDVGTLVWLLHCLVRQVRPGVTVYCIIDNISALEGSLNDWGEALRQLARGLLAIAGDEKLGAAFKLLITSEDRSTDVIRWVPPEKHIVILGGFLQHRPL